MSETLQAVPQEAPFYQPEALLDQEPMQQEAPSNIADAALLAGAAAMQEEAPEARKSTEGIRGSRLGTALAVAGSALALMAGTTETADASRTAHPEGSKTKVVTIKAKSVGVAKKFQKCLAKGEKKEQPAPPADPNALCKGKVKVRVKAKAVASCKPGYMGGRAVAKSSVSQRIRVKAYAEAIAEGRAEAKAKTIIRDRVKANAAARVDCVKIEDQPTPPTKPPTRPPEKPPIKPPVLLPPTVEVDNPNHVGTNGVIAFCAREADADGHIVNRSFEASRGNYVSNVYPGNDEGEYCRDYRGPSSPQDVTLSVEVTDNDGKSAEDSTTFPVVALPR